MRLNPSESIPTASSKAENWKQWHIDLKRIFGKKKANSLWLYAWQKRGGINSKADNSDLRSYMDKQGVNITTTKLNEISDIIGDVLGFSFGVGKILIIVAVSFGGLVALGLLIRLFRSNKPISFAPPSIPLPKNQ